MTAFSADNDSDRTTDILEQIFRDVLNEPHLEFVDDISTENTPSWDSLAHISLMFSIESAFDITFSDEEMSELSNAGDVRRAVMQKTGS